MKYKKIFFCFILFFLGTNIFVFGQFLKDITAQQMATEATEYIYSFDFKNAKISIDKLNKRLPNHPVVPFLYAYLMSWQTFPLQKNYGEYTQYEKYLQTCLAQSKEIIKKNKQDIEGNYFAMMSYSLMAMHESEAGNFWASVELGKSAFYYLKKGFDWGEKLADYYFTTGLYRYYAIQYPETHASARVAMIFFPNGDKIQGLKYLQLASTQSKFSKIEAFIYLHGIYSKYEKNYLNALAQTQNLIQKYPYNPFFALKHCESLIFVGRYAEAELLLPRFASLSGRMYRVATNTFKGLIYEKYYKNNTTAQTFYKNSVDIANADVRYSKDFQAQSYIGLGRIALANGQKEQAKKYFKKAEKMTEYEGLKDEIKQYLKKL
ncbi:MAG: hypothetical protein EAZ85_08070 [Bacteroidetes bacterium]|nr:MAG: hypothetical protein EAZ85_08070 [Bacteroidota bacterium]TAG89100.1 MAG: hypothetical protein EAZ20_07215 [Bacteroidota bacterium]